MVLDYAKTRSDATVLREGGSEELEAHKRKRLAEKGGQQRTHSSMMQTTLEAYYTNYCQLFPQSVNKRTTPSRPRRSSSVPPPPRLSTTHAQQRPRRAPVSSPHPVLRLRLFSTSICLPTRFSSCGICPTTPARRVSQRSLVVSKDSRKSDWYPAARVLPSSSTRPSQVLLARRRLRQVCPWESRASQFVLRSSGSKYGCGSRGSKISLSCSFGVWRGF